MGMNENLPIYVEDTRDVGNITYANEVIAIIAGMAAGEVDGVASMTNASSIADLFGRTKSITRGVKVEVGTEEASVDLMLTVEYGKPIQRVCVEVQEGVRKAIETMTGLHVLKVDVHVMGVSFEKETQEMARGYDKVMDDAVPEPARPRDRVKIEPVEYAGEPDDGIDDIDTDIPEADGAYTAPEEEEILDGESGEE